METFRILLPFAIEKSQKPRGVNVCSFKLTNAVVVKGGVRVQRKKLARKGSGPVAKPTASQV